MLFHEQPTDPWTLADFKLIEAYQTLLDETCSDCGQPVWLCHSEDENLHWAVKTQTCYASKKLKTWQEQQSKSKKSDHGIQPYVVPFVYKQDDDGDMIEDYESLPTRKDFFEQKVDENG